MTTPSASIVPKNSSLPPPESDLALQAQKMEMVGRMASSVIHDLNNFLTVIQLNAALLEDVAEDPSERTRMIGEINRACTTAAGLTRKMLSFARQKKSKIEILELQKLLGETVGVFKCLVPHKAEILTDFPETEIWVEGDRSALVQAFMNLVLNALDASPDQGLELTLRADETEVEVAITDFGEGISADDLPLIFEPFFTTKSDEKGTGLGLPIVRQVVESHGGRIAVETAKGEGSTFRIILPRQAGPSVELPVATPEIPAPPRQNGLTLLVVEDDAGIRNLTSQILKRAGYEVFSAGNVEEARQIWAAHSSAISLLFTDIVLPGDLSGEDLAIELRAISPQLIVLFTSGNMTARQLWDAPFISKPFAPNALIETVRGLIG